MTEHRAAIEASLRSFQDQPLLQASLTLLGALGYRSAKTIALDGDPQSFAREVDHERKLATQAAMFDHWKKVQFLFQLTNDEIPMLGQDASGLETKERYGRSIVDSFVFLAIELEGDAWKRADLAGITRAVNAVFAMPVIIIFSYNDLISLATSERRQNRRDASRDVQTGRISIVLGISTLQPHRGHLSILENLNWQSMPSRPTNFDDLYKGWQRALSTKLLNEAFYKELSKWFFWARAEVTFPDGARRLTGEDRSKEQWEVPLIRLLTRIIFCWFIKERGLVPASLFRLESIRPLLLTDPSEFPEESNYYKAVLQNLFFATLNTEMGEGRDWRSRNSGKGQDGHHMVHSLYRYKEMFADPEAALALFREIPFLNGGLFECLDREVTEQDLERNLDLKTRVPDGKRLRVDGFSDHKDNVLKVPNRIFFGEEIAADLNEVYSTTGKTYDVQGLFTLFDQYVFTVEENTSYEEEVALDPELLGKVFENLLASYNDETSTTARKKSGAFYTPRYVVDYMVRETLTHQFSRALSGNGKIDVGKIGTTSGVLDLGPVVGELELMREPNASKLQSSRRAVTDRFSALFGPDGTPHDFTEGEVDRLIGTIENLTVLDPACGSGAYPMGMLQALMAVLKKLDPNNDRWRAAMRAPLEDRISNAGRYDTTRRGIEQDEAEAALASFDAEFADQNLADYVRKLHLIERCLYGADIQPVAILIAKLRFFISLAVEQKPHADHPNLGIKPLPNLETKLVAANSLIPLKRPEQSDLFENPRIAELEALIEDANQRHFGARTMKTKRKYRAIIQEHRDELADILEREHGLEHADAKMAATWNPFDQNASAPFFDPAWMFNLRDGFDIVIGNPPYIRQEKFKDQKPALKAIYGQKEKGVPTGSYSGTADYLVYFIERGIRLLKPGGAFSYITSNKWYRAKYGENLRYWMQEQTNLQTIIDFGDAPVFDAIAYPTIVVAERREGMPIAGHAFRALNWQALGDGADVERFFDNLESNGFNMPQTALEKDGWQIEPATKRETLLGIIKAGPSLKDFISDKVFRGVTTGRNEAFELNFEEANELLSKSPKNSDIILPYLTGTDIQKWSTPESEKYILFARRGVELSNYPGAKEHLEKFRRVLEPRPNDWSSTANEPKWIGRKTGNYRWYEIQDNTAYWKKFLKEKIISTKISFKPTFSIDKTGSVLGNTAYLIDGGVYNRFLTILLNSSVAEYYFRSIFVGKQGGFYEVQPKGLETFPVSKFGADSVLNKLDFSFSPPTPALEQLLNGLVYELYFPEDLHARGLHIFDEVHKVGLQHLSSLHGEALISAATDFTRQNLSPGQPLRVMLSDLQTLDVVRIIEGKA